MNKWAFKTETKEARNAIQGMAFAFGYKWVGMGNNQKLEDVDFPVLILDPERKQLTCHHTDLGYHLIASFDEAVKYFNKTQSASVANGYLTVFADGSMETGSYRFSKTDVNELIEKRKELMGEKEESEKLPYVAFDYQSASGTYRRYILVKKCDIGESIEGLDTDDGNKYKKYLYKNIKGFVEFKGFQKPE